MGVQGLRDLIQRKYRGHVGVASGAREGFDVVAIEINPLLHSMVDTSVGDKCRRLAELLDELTATCSLLEGARVGLFLDGPAPVGKLPVQRTRRVKYCTSRLDITPGTTFMDAVVEALLAWAARTCEKREDISVLVSSARVPGEGETKLIRWIRSAEIVIQKTSRICCIGGDTDLLLAALSQSHLHNVLVYDSIARTATNLGTMAFHLTNHTACAPIVAVTAAKLDFAALSFFNGSDYLPALPCFDTTGSWAAYCKKKTPLISDTDFSVNLPLLRSVLKKKETGLKKKKKKRGGGNPKKYLLTWLWSVKMLVTGTCPSYRHCYSSLPPDFDEIIVFLKKMEEKCELLEIPSNANDLPPTPLQYLACTLPCEHYTNYLPKNVAKAMLSQEISLSDSGASADEVVSIVEQCFDDAGRKSSGFEKEVRVTSTSKERISSSPCSVNRLQHTDPVAFSALLGVGDPWTSESLVQQNEVTAIPLKESLRPQTGICAVAAVLLALTLGAFL